MKKLFTTMMLVMAAITTWAYDVEVDGIYYDLSSTTKTAEVTYKNIAFSSYSGSVVIPKTVVSDGVTYSVTSIGYGAFQDCTGLTSVTIPNSVTSIGHDAFYHSTGLTSVTIPNSVTSISYYAFQDCTGLTSVTIPNSVTSIENSAFYGCRGLQSIIVDSRNTVYDSRDNCNAIIKTSSNTLIIGCKNTVIPNSVRSIGDCAFHGCTGLTSVDIPNSVTIIGDDAFAGCTGLTSVTIGNSVTSIGQYAFGFCSSLSYVKMSNKVTSIGSYAFSSCSKLPWITIPSTVTSIGDGAFSGCTSLKNVVSLITYPGKVSITSTTFSVADTINVPSGSVRYYKNTTYWKDFKTFNPVSGTAGDCLWYYNETTRKETIWGNGTMVNGTSGCIGNSGVKELEILDGVTNIADSAFMYCRNLKSAVIPNSVKTIGKLAFSCCTVLQEINIPNSVTSLGYWCFQYCDSIKSIDIPNSVTYIGPWCFIGCENLSSVKIPASVKTMYTNPFSDCNNLSSIIVDQNNKYFDSRNNCNAIIETASNQLISGCYNTIIPNGVSSIDSCAFRNCNKLSNIVIPNSVTRICNEAFRYCNGLTSLTIPKSTNYIEQWAFNGCTDIKTLIVEPATPPALGYSVFDNVDKTIPVYVPGESIDVYKSADGWKDFTNISAITIKATSIALDKETASLKAGETSQLTATVLPEDATDKTVTWKSSDTNIATVSEAGLVTTLAEGTATITATTNDETNLSANCVITVTHNLTVIAAKAATCTEAGNKAYWHCSSCNKYFSDADATTETTLEALTIPALGHNLSSVNNGDGTHTTTCSRCDYKVTENHSLVDGVCSVCGAKQITGAAKIYTKNITAKANSSATLPVFMNNSTSICSAQFDLTLPEGVSVDYTTNRAGAKVYSVSLGTERFEDLDHSVSVTQQENGAYRFVISSNTNASIWDEDASGADIREAAPLLNITLKTAEEMTDGDYTVSIDNVTLAHYDSEQKTVEKFTAIGETSTLTIKNACTIAVTSEDVKMGNVAVTGDHYDSTTGQADCNTNVTLTATPADGYVFIAWKENGASLSTENPLTLTITENRTISAEFALLGDVYADNVIDVADVSSVINIILNDIKLSDREMKIADVYADNVIDVADASSVVNIILNPGKSKMMASKRSYGDSEVSLSARLNGENGRSTLGISLDDPSYVTTALQFDVKLSNGLSFDGNSLVMKAKDIAHSIACKQISSDRVRVIMYSMSNDAICTDEESMMNIGLVLPGDYGSEQINICNIKGFTVHGESYRIEDQSISLSDVTGINSISYDMVSASDVYSVSGQLVKTAGSSRKLPKGIYIINGKKTAVK